MMTAFVFEKTNTATIKTTVGEETRFDGVAASTAGVMMYKYTNIKGVDIAGGGAGVEITLSDNTTVSYGFDFFRICIMGG